MDITAILRKAAEATFSVARCNDDKIRQVLQAISRKITEQIPYILKENARDVVRMDVSNPKRDRLLLTNERLRGMAEDVIHVSQLDSPVGKTLSEGVRPNGMRIRKVAVPLGVVGVIYEARPNVTLDVFSLCLRTQNVCVLKGGSDAQYTNEAIVKLIHEVLTAQGVPEEVCSLLPAGREASSQLLNAVGLVDVVIPRGSSQLIDFVRDNARIPVIETGAGVCHTFLDETGNRSFARAIVTNAKTRRVSVCNALDCFIISKERTGDLSYICRDLAKSNVVIYADETAYSALKDCYPLHLLLPATDDSYGKEFLDYKMSVYTAPLYENAIAHINKYSSKHSECIISESAENIARFEQCVDAACVYSNVSTAFTDGGQFGFGAEVGISTQKLHARGPMGLEALTSYKYLINGNGQIRENN